MPEGVQVWLVERTYAEDRDLVQLTYATIDGEQYLRREQSAARADDDPPHGVEVDGSKLSKVPDADDRDRYQQEAERVAERHGDEER
jgi:hypothetical protein